MTKTAAFTLIAVAAAIAVAALLWNYPSYSPANSEKIKVSATFFPVYDIASRIGGEKIDVVRILPAGASPHAFDLTPEKAKEMKGSKIVFKIGGVDDWIDQISESAGAEKIVLKKGIAIREYSVPTIGEEENNGEAGDPHYWMTVRNAKIIAQNIAAELSKIDPDNAGYFEANLSEFGAKADVADAEIRSILAPHSGKSLIVFHNAWSYFAEEYGLNIAASFEPAPGKEPSANHLKDLSDAVKNGGIKVIFSEPAFSGDSIRSFVSDLGLKLYVLYPEEGSSKDASFFDTMIENARVIARALSE